MCKEELSNTPKWDKSKLLLVVLAVIIALVIIGTFKGIADFIVGMAWPVVACIIFWYLKPAIVGLIGRIKKFGVGNTFAETEPIDQSQTVAKAENEKPFDDLEKMITDDPCQAAKDVRDLVKQLEFQKIFSSIYGSQMRFLDFLNKNEGISKPSDIDNVFYKEYVYAVSAIRPPIAPLPYDVWRYLLEDHKLVEPAINKLTQNGKQFIEYLRDVYPKGAYLHRSW